MRCTVQIDESEENENESICACLDEPITVGKGGIFTREAIDYSRRR